MEHIYQYQSLDNNGDLMTNKGKVRNKTFFSSEMVEECSWSLHKWSWHADNKQCSSQTSVSLSSYLFTDQHCQGSQHGVIGSLLIHTVLKSKDEARKGWTDCPMQDGYYSIVIDLEIPVLY